MAASDEERIKQEAANELRYKLSSEYSIEYGEIYLSWCGYYADIVVRNQLGIPILAAECKADSGCIRKGIGQALSYSREEVVPLIVAPNLDKYEYILQSTPLWGMYSDYDYKLASNPSNAKSEDILDSMKPDLGSDRVMHFTKRIKSHPSVEIPSRVVDELNITSSSKLQFIVASVEEDIP